MNPKQHQLHVLAVLVSHTVCEWKARLTFMNFASIFISRECAMQGLSTSMASSEHFQGRVEAISHLYAFTSVCYTQPSHYCTEELTCRCCIFPTASPIIKIFSGHPASCLVLFKHSSRYGTACVPGTKTNVEVCARAGSAIYG